MSTASTHIDEVVKRYIAPALKRADFRKSGRTWHKDMVDAVLLVNVQGSAWNSAGSARFTINLGVWFPEVALLAGDPPSQNRRPSESWCTLRQRIGSLLPASEDVWWDVADEHDVDPVGKAVAELLTTAAIRWLDERSDPKKALLLLDAERDAGVVMPLQRLALSLHVDGPAAARELYNEWLAAGDRSRATLVHAWAEAHDLIR